MQVQTSSPLMVDAVPMARSAGAPVLVTAVRQKATVVLNQAIVSRAANQHSGLAQLVQMSFPLMENAVPMVRRVRALALATAARPLATAAQNPTTAPQAVKSLSAPAVAAHPLSQSMGTAVLTEKLVSDLPTATAALPKDTAALPTAIVTRAVNLLSETALPLNPTISLQTVSAVQTARRARTRLSATAAPHRITVARLQVIVKLAVNLLSAPAQPAPAKSPPTGLAV
jgi:hypothetical protein